MHVGKRILSVVLSVVLVVGLCPATAMAAGQDASGASATLKSTLAAGSGPIGVSGVDSVTIEGLHADAAEGGITTALLSDGSCWRWGYDDFGCFGDETCGYPFPVKLQDSVRQARDYIYVKKDGSLWVWGFSLRDRWGMPYKKPTHIADGVKAAYSAGAPYITGAYYVLKEDESVSYVEVNYSGSSSADNPVITHTETSILEGVIGLSSGGSHTAAIKKDGTLWMWGQNGLGQIGDGTTETRDEPVKILDGVTDVICTNRGSTYAITKDSSLFAWGRNSDGQLGDGSYDDLLAPKKVLDDVKSISVSPLGRSCCAVKKDGSLWTWGYNGSEGILCDGTTENRPSPAKVMDGVSQAVVGSAGAALKTDGTLWTWGHRWYCGCGDIDDGYRTDPICIFSDGSFLYTRDLTLNDAKFLTYDEIYTGSAIKPGSLWTAWDTPLWEGVHYTLSCKNNVNVGTATVTAKGIGRYSGSVTATFRIVPASMGNALVFGLTSPVYTGGKFTPSPKVKVNGRTLKEGTDYSLSYKNNVNAGTATVTVKGKGNYTGSTSETFKISAASLAKATVALSKTSVAYTGSVIKPAVKSVKLGSKALTAGTDYTVTYSSNKNAGTAKAVVKGKGNYAGTATKTFTITKASNPMSVAGKAATVSYSKKKAQTVKASAAYNFKKKAVGKVTYSRVASGSSKWLPKVDSSTGAITVKAGAPKGKVPQVKVKLTAKGDANRKSATKTVTVKVKVR